MLVSRCNLVSKLPVQVLGFSGGFQLLNMGPCHCLGSGGVRDLHRAYEYDVQDRIDPYPSGAADRD